MLRGGVGRGAVIAVCLNPLAEAPEAERILVVRLAGVGEVARTLPAAARLRATWPGAHLAWLVGPAAASLLESVPWLDEVLVFPRAPLAASGAWAAGRALAGFVRALRARRFDLVVDFDAVARSALLALASGSARRASYEPPFARELAWVAATDRARLAPPRQSRFERNDGLARFLGAEAAVEVEPLPVDPVARARMREALGPGPAPIALHPGTSERGARKRLPAALYAGAAQALRDALGAGSIVTWGPARDDRALAEAVVAASDGAARLAPATPGLAELAALLAECRLAVGPDTGPLHVASLVGTPVVQLLGLTDAVENAPWTRTPSRSLRGWPGASEASARRALAPAAIVEAARELLAESAAKALRAPARARIEYPAGP